VFPIGRVAIACMSSGGTILMSHRTDRNDGLTSVLASERAYLLRFARSRLRDRDTAEDAVQDTLLAALRSLDRFERRSALRTWLTGILGNKIADAVRRERRDRGRPGVEPDAATEGPCFAGDVEPTVSEPAEWQCPERVVAARQAARLVGEGVDRLPPLARRVFELRELEGLSNVDTARALGLTPGRGALLLHRTRRRLRDSLAQAL
jgi:RNA polymerase sigma-70 factor (ECF subfamily)